MAQPNEELLRYALIGYEEARRRIEAKIMEIRQQLSGSPAVAEDTNVSVGRGKRNLSTAARNRIAAAQKARWAAYRGETNVEEKQTVPSSDKKKQ